jgi:CelD/BcsL family acetyltransferase involved in cellulose biosynthesis
VSVCVACSPAAIDRLRSPWERLYCRERHTIFQSFAWNRLAAEIFSDRESPYVVYAENSSGAAIIPAAIATRQVTFLGESLFDYRDVLTSGDGRALKAAWLQVARLGLPLDVAGVRSGGEQWRGLGLKPFSEAPCIRAEDKAQFATHARAGRLVRRLQRLGAKVKHYDGSATELLQRVYSRKAAQLGGHNLFTDPRRVEFVVRAVALAPASVDVFTFETDAMIAALVTLRDGRVRRFYTTWFDDAWAHYSPGTALLFHLTQQSLAEGLDCDYMTGTQSHKRRFAMASVPLFRAQASREQLARIAMEAGPAEVAA